MAVQILQQVDLPDRSGTIFLYDWMAPEMADGRNIVKCTPQGRVVWRAKPPTGTPDCFVGMRLESGAISANSFSGYLTSINIRTGAVIVVAFTK